MLLLRTILFARGLGLIDQRPVYLKRLKRLHNPTFLQTEVPCGGEFLWGGGELIHMHTLVTVHMGLLSPYRIHAHMKNIPDKMGV